MSEKNNGGMAFPMPNDGHCGMMLRDYFAAKALPAILADPNDGVQVWEPTAKGGGAHTIAEVWARRAYEISDAMLAERAK